MSSPKPVKPPTPGQAATAAIGTAGAGTLMDTANAPIQAYGNLYTNTMLDPYLSKTQTAVQNQAALQAASAQQDIQARLDPMAYQQRQMRLKASTQKLGRLYGMDPSAFTFSAPGAYQTANLAKAPSLGQLSGDSRLIANALQLAKVSGSGGDPTLYTDPSQAGKLSGGGVSYGV
jgi:hypothetical protein